MSQSRGANAIPRVVRDRIRDEDSVIVERIVILVLAAWLGGLLMVTLSAAGSFRAVHTSMDKPSAVVVKSIARLGIEDTRAVLRDHSGEVNRQVFELWGWIQLGVMGAVLLALLFLTNARKSSLGLAAGMTGASALMAGYLIPGIVRVGRQMRAGPEAPSADLTASFERMHQAFGGFEILTALLSLFLIAALLGRGSRARA